MKPTRPRKYEAPRPLSPVESITATKDGVVTKRARPAWHCPRCSFTFNPPRPAEVRSPTKDEKLDYSLGANSEAPRSRPPS